MDVSEDCLSRLSTMAVLVPGPALFQKVTVSSSPRSELKNIFEQILKTFWATHYNILSTALGIFSLYENKTARRIQNQIYIAFRW